MTPGVRGLGPVWSPTANYTASLSSVSLIYKTEKKITTAAWLCYLLKEIMFV